MSDDEYKMWVQFKDWIVADAIRKGRNEGQARSLLESPTGKFAWAVWKAAAGNT